MRSQSLAPTKPDARDAGFTLGEALISVVLTVMVITAAIETLTRTLSLTGTSRTMSETNHGLQAATSLLVRDVMQTGQGLPLGGIPIPSGDDSVLVFRPTPAAGSTFPFGTSVVTAVLPGDGLGPTVNGNVTDMMSVLYADRTLNIGVLPLAAVAADGSSVTFDAGEPVTGVGGLKAGDLVLFSNPEGQALQMVTTTPTDQTVAFADADAMRLNQPLAESGTLVQLQDPDAPGTFPTTTATRVSIVSYYIDTVTDPALPRLVRRVNMGNRLAIALGIENLQITYDIVNGTTNPTAVAAPAGANQIRKVNVSLSARSQEVDPQTGQFFRNQMTTEIGLRSLSFVDRYR
jgi:hypothetical protein